jgi:hypothetical protein
MDEDCAYVSAEELLGMLKKLAINLRDTAC